ncbi:hypothetical protein GGR54DRAFT_638245 [Hypoxylon sp. NC1633]|nr:hypothetical protein GGR54DRAFT_638245 [Hypoxylon sp. NC1633]
MRINVLCVPLFVKGLRGNKIQRLGSPEKKQQKNAEVTNLIRNPSRYCLPKLQSYSIAEYTNAGIRNLTGCTGCSPEVTDEKKFNIIEARAEKDVVSSPADCHYRKPGRFLQGSRGVKTGHPRTITSDPRAKPAHACLAVATGVTVHVEDQIHACNHQRFMVLVPADQIE